MAPPPAHPGPPALDLVHRPHGWVLSLLVFLLRPRSKRAGKCSEVVGSIPFRGCQGRAAAA